MQYSLVCSDIALHYDEPWIYSLGFQIKLHLLYLGISSESSYIQDKKF